MLTRFTAKHSDVLSCRVIQPSPESKGSVMAAALRSPKGNLTLIVLNPAEQDVDARLTWDGLAGAPVKFHRYQVTESATAQAGFSLVPRGEFSVSAANTTFQDRLPARSVTTYSTFHLTAEAPGVIKDEEGRE
jgi:hypothetical protein